MADHGGPIANLMHALHAGANRNKVIELELYPQACRDLIEALSALQSPAPDMVPVPREECERIARELAADPVNRMANAEDALLPPPGFEVSEYQAIHHPGMLQGFPKICKRGPGAWTVFCDDTACLGKDRHWHYEPRPSNRTPEFIKLTRFATPQEAAAALAALRSGEAGKGGAT